MRLKPPAYGRKILLERRAGKHPHTISVIYGDDWYGAAQSCQAMLCIKPGEYEPGTYDFHMVSGCEVAVFDQSGAFVHDMNARPPTFGKFFDLLAELAAADASVCVVWPGDTQRGLNEIASSMRWWNGEQGRWDWPRWWSDALHLKHFARESAWLAGRRRDIVKLNRERDRAA